MPDVWLNPTAGCGCGGQHIREASTVPAVVRASAPDIVLFMTDQQRRDQTGYASAQHFETPNLDALASRGVIFETAYSASTTCVPARVALMTGLSPRRAPVVADFRSLPEDYWTVGHALRHAGYATALVGKAHANPIRADHGFETLLTCEHLFPFDFTPERDVPGGFDHYHDWLEQEQGVRDWRRRMSTDTSQPSEAFPYDVDLHPTNWIADQARAVLERRDPERPLFLVVSFPHPHEPHNPPDPYATMYDPADSVLPPDGFEVNAGLPGVFVEQLTQSEMGPWGPTPVPSEAYLRGSLAIVRGLVKQIDDGMGRVLDVVDRDRTAIFFTSDHGDYAGHRGLIRKIPWIPFDDLALVPFVASAPDAVAGRRVETPVRSCDFVLTCLDYAGVDVDTSIFDTRSLRPLLTDQAGPDDIDRTIMCATETAWPAIRQGSMKLITRRHCEASDWTLLDLDADPGETVNVIADPAYADAFAALSERLDAEMELPIAELPSRADLSGDTIAAGEGRT
jgi:arylsulfatase